MAAVAAGSTMSLLLFSFCALCMLARLSISVDGATCDDGGSSTDTSVTLCTRYPRVGLAEGWLTSPNNAYQAQITLMPVQLLNHSVCWLQIAFKSTGEVSEDEAGTCALWYNQTVHCAISWRSQCIENPAGVNCSAVLTKDGDLALKSGGRVRWDTDTAGKGGTAVRLNNDGHLQIVGPTNNTVWSSDSLKSKKIPDKLDDCVRINHASLPLPSPFLLLSILFMLSLLWF